MKSRRRYTGLLILAGIALVAGLGVTLYYWHAKLAVFKYRRQLIAAGEKLSVRELLPAPLPKEEDGAELFYKVAAVIPSGTSDLFDTNPPPSMCLVAPGKAMIGWQQTEFSDGKGTNNWDDVSDTLDSMSPALQLLDQMATKKAMDFHFNYNQGFSGLLPMLAPMKRAQLRLNAATVLKIHDGDEEAAARHIRAMLGLTRGLTDERLVISQLVRMAHAAIAQAATWEFLQSTNVTDTQLAAIQRDWAAIEFILPLERALEMERAMSEMTIGDMRESSTEFHKVADGFGRSSSSGGFSLGTGDFWERGMHIGKQVMEKTADASKEAAWRVAWSYPDQLRFLKGSQVLIESLRTAQTNKNFGAIISTARQRLNSLGLVADQPDFDISSLFGDDQSLQTFFSQSIPSLAKTFTKIMRIESQNQLLITAIALKRFQLAHGKLPDELSQLSPAILPTLPIDPANGEPLHYKPNADGTFLLYSVGEDGKDDGGDSNPTPAHSMQDSWFRGRDWVWPQPANEQEIRDYFLKRVKR